MKYLQKRIYEDRQLYTMMFTVDLFNKWAEDMSTPVHIYISNRLYYPQIPLS